MTNIFDALEREHDKHRTLLDLVEKTSGDSAGRRELFAKLARELRSHANAEERTLYAQMLGDAGAQPKASHSVHEHEELDQLVEQLENTDRSSSGWIATFQKLSEQAHHHMKEEENETFAEGRKLIGDQRAAELGERFLTEKASEMKKQSVEN